MSDMPDSLYPYATAADYAQYGSGGIPAEKLEKLLHRASRQIDSLTYNRMIGLGFGNLTEFQQGIVKESCCLLADFLHDNADLLDSALSAYSINGVSMNFGGGQMTVINGIPVRRDIYALLGQSGLCSLILNGRYFSS